MENQIWRQRCLQLAPVSACGAIACAVLNRSEIGLFSVVTFILIALGIASIRSLRGFQFTAWVITAIVAAMFFPDKFIVWTIPGFGPVELRNKILMLVIIQLVMFGMGTQMSLREFRGILSMPHAVFVGDRKSVV